jgi:hypothetical protein
MEESLYCNQGVDLFNTFLPQRLWSKKKFLKRFWTAHLKYILLWDQDCLKVRILYLYYDLIKSGLRVEKQKALPLIYETVHLEAGYRKWISLKNV